MFLDQLLLVVLLIVTLAVVYMLYRFYSLVQRKGSSDVERVEVKEPESEDTGEPV